MAYERYSEDDPQDDPRLRPQPGIQTQPMGMGEPMDFGADRVPTKNVKQDFMADPQQAGMPVQDRKRAFGGLMSLGAGGNNPLGGSNTGVAGGKDRGAPAPMAGGAMARYGTGNIAGAENMSRGNYMGQLEGFNTGAWDNAPEGYEADSIKNTFGKIASRYDVTQPGAVRALMADPDFQRFFPEAQIIDHPNGDLIDFGDGKPVDVIRAAVAGGSGEGWQWGADDGMGDAGGMGGDGMAVGDPMGLPNLQSILAGSDPLTDIIKRIEDLQGGGTPDAEQQALIEMIRGGNI